MFKLSMVAIRSYKHKHNTEALFNIDRFKTLYSSFLDDWFVFQQIPWLDQVEADGLKCGIGEISIFVHHSEMPPWFKHISQVLIVKCLPFLTAFDVRRQNASSVTGTWILTCGSSCLLGANFRLIPN